MTIYIIYALIIVSIFVIVKGLTPQRYIDKEKLYARLPTSASAKMDKKFKMRMMLKPLFLPLEAVVRKLKLEAGLKRKLLAAHLQLTPAEFFASKIITIFAAVSLVRIGFGINDPVKIAVSIAVGYILPDMWLNKKVTKRKNIIAKLLPETVDLIGLCIEAGQDFTMSVKWILQKTKPNPLLEEFALVLEEISWGKPRVQALKDMAQRLNIPEVNSFVQSLVQAERMGTPVGEAFAILSEDTRMRRFQRGERMALKAPIKILVPLLFFILPVIGIIVMGPVLLQFMQQRMSLQTF